MPPLSHLTSCTHTKSNLYLGNYLAATISEPALYRLLTSQVPNFMCLFRYLDRTKVSAKVRGKCSGFVKKSQSLRWGVVNTSSTPSWRTTSCRLSATSHSIYSQIPYRLEAVPPSATWGRAIPWWQGPTYHGLSQAQRRQIVIHLVQKLPTKNTAIHHGHQKSTPQDCTLSQFYQLHGLATLFLVWVHHTVKQRSRSGLRKFYIVTESSKIIHIL